MELEGLIQQKYMLRSYHASQGARLPYWGGDGHAPKLSPKNLDKGHIEHGISGGHIEGTLG